MKKVVIIGIVALLFTLNGYGAELKLYIVQKNIKELIEAQKKYHKTIDELLKIYKPRKSPTYNKMISKCLKQGWTVTEKYDPIMQIMLKDQSIPSESLKTYWSCHLEHQKNLIKLARCSLDIFCKKRKKTILKKSKP